MFSKEDLGDTVLDKIGNNALVVEGEVLNGTHLL